MSVLDRIIDVRDAAKMWGLSPDHVKKLCRDGDVQAKKIGNSWAVLKNQENPKQRGRKKMKNFKTVGNWWADKEIELVEIDGKVYALNGWNGEKYIDCWEAIGEDHAEASEEKYEITPISEEVDGDFETVGYEVV